ncbi:hypothetical protein CPT_Muldoon_247 [Serratia phage Muldoon]|uniref:Uncharacterized protein n=1 Tax=Serratia phage Muldoon TaxID=2601678 RepID=A0A5P8PHI5_9CAUD|nr:hypothetical protein HYP94_gp143 [Serratia phage Muldoon]QFR56198.1 hypothetical protein CPT_Muldoon_247 [Serratia phage Muldoon]UNA02353.1 hypothetical protein [Serratia phage SP1]
MKIYSYKEESDRFVLVANMSMKEWLDMMGISTSQMKYEWIGYCQDSDSIYFNRIPGPKGIVQFSWTEEAWRQEYK